MKTRRVGEVLQAERQAQDVSLESLAAQTRIKVTLLEALENNDFEALPAAVFVKGYIRAYARVLGFDQKPVIALLRRDFKESARGQLIPREFLKPSHRRQAWLTPFRLMAAGLSLAAVVVLGYVGLQMRALSQPPLLVVTQPAESAVVAPKVTVRGMTQPENMVWVQDQPVALRPDGSFTTEVVLPTEGLATIKVVTSDRKGKQTLKERTVLVKY